jgi:SAM-dependent methyltransferase
MNPIQKLNRVVTQQGQRIAALEPSDLSEEDLVRLAYLVLLGRTIDVAGLAHWQQRIAAGEFEPRAMVDELCASPEFKERQLNRLGFLDMLHRARGQWCGSLAPFERVLDIGGSSPNLSAGALIELGYSHRPREITIMDLPPDQQYWGKPKFPQDQDYVFDWGTVRYVHGFAEKIQDCPSLQEQRFNMIYMGQAIEHILPDKLPDTLQWVRSHLAPEGRFIFDTPNRDITKIQFPDRYIDADHKREYSPAEMAALLGENGFEVVRQWGMLNMPETYRTGQFDPEEIYQAGESLNQTPETSYVFAFECRVRE